MPKKKKNKLIPEPVFEEASASAATAPEPITAPARKAPRAKGATARTAAKKKGGAAQKSGGKRKAIAPKITEPTDAEISLRAYFIAERRLQLALQGDPANDWIEARKQLLAEARQARS